MPINSRSKGARGEMEFAEWLFKKGLVMKIPNRNLEQVRSGGIDIIPDEHPFAYEVKRVEKFTDTTLDKWWFKAVLDAKKEGREPVVAFRTNKGNWSFLVSLEGLLGLPGSYARIKDQAFIKFASKRIAGYGSQG